MAYIYILALLFFTITNGQETETAWSGAGANDTITNDDNWTNGPPGPDSTVYVNQTSCTNCDLTFDEDIVIGSLIIDSTTTVYLRIVGKNVTIGNVLTLGNPTTSTSVYIIITGGGVFEIGENCQATIHYTNSNPIYGYDDEDNWFVNKGTVTFIGTTGVTSYNYINIGSSSDVLNIDSWGNWVATDGLINVIFYYIDIFNVHGGSFTGTILNADTDPSINFYYTDVVLQEGSNDPFNVVSFTAQNIQSGTSEVNDPPPSSLIFNSTADQTVSNATFYGTNIVASKNIWLNNVNLTYYTLVNITAGDVYAYFTGNNYFDNAILVSLETDTGKFQVQEGATVTMTSYFSLYGAITLLNYGTWVYDSSSYLYFDENAYWVNLGTTSVIRSSSCFIWGSSFPGISPRTDAGTFVNMGTIEFTAGGGLNFQDGTGTFLQCKNGIMKFGYGYPATGNTPGSVTLPETLGLNGYVGLALNDALSAASTIFYWKENADETIFDGSVKLSVYYEDLDLTLITPFLCFDPTTGYVQLYDFSYDNSLFCPNDDQTQILGGLPGVDVCADLPAEILALQDNAPCRADKNCGINTGTISGGGGDGTSGAFVNTASVAFLVSLVCLLLKF